MRRTGLTMPEPDLPPSQPAVPAYEPLPLPPRQAAAPSARWLALARRWWQPAHGTANAEATHPASAPLRAMPEATAVPLPGASGVPRALVARLRRCVDHAVRHPGFGFALMRLELALPAAAADPRRLHSADLSRQVERRLRLALRPGDALVALAAPPRVDGLTFLSVLDGLGSGAHLETVVRRVLADLAEPFLVGLQPLKPVPRLGVVFCAPGQALRSAGTLLQQTEDALADASPGDWALAGKDACRPRVDRLQQALRSGALQVVFEPQVDLRRPMIRALGARLAWRDAAPRPIDAGDDDPRAEALLQRTLALAAAHFLPWRAADAGRSGCRLALPAVAALVRRADWADTFAALLQDNGLACADVQLELPPTLGVQDRNLPARLQVLARSGLVLALDDFGTGRSSLSALARLPLALLKIDRGFVPQAHALEHHRVLLESTVRLATQLGIATLGKGLQTSAQLALLRDLGCERGEGEAASALLAPAALAGLPRRGVALS
jgi:EAL domain-containing protein (putative c-di-GMP-specific phosphodiesterase class I)